MMTREIRQAVGRPDNSVFIRRCIIYGAVLAAMLFAAPSIFAKLMVPMAAKGMTTAWYTVFVPLTAAIMAIGLFRCWRRRWPLAYMDNYRAQAKANDYEICPRCGAALVLKRRTRNSREKVGELVTTTTYTDGSKTVNKEDIYGNVRRTEYYHECTNSVCALEAEQTISQSHLPWKVREIRALVLNDPSLLGRKNRCAKHLLLSRLMVPFLALVILAACAVTIYSYADLQDGEWTNVTANKESSRSAEDYQSYLLSLDTEYPGWHVTYAKEPTDMMSYLSSIFGKEKATEYTFGWYTFEGNTAFEYRFKGDDAGTGLPNGWYTLAQMDGTNVLIDDTNDTIYKQGTAFYDTYAPKLQALVHDIALSTVLERVSGGEHALSGTNDFWMEFVRKDDSMLYSYMLADDVTKISGQEFRAITLYPEEHMREQWIFSYDTSEFNPLEDLDGYVYSDAAPVDPDDELGKLIRDSSDGNGSIVFYKNDEAALELDVEYYPDGYAFEVEGIEEDFGEGLEEDMVYRVNTSNQTLIKIENYGYSDEIKTDMPLSEHQATYDFLVSLVPDAYIRRIIDMDQAEVRKEKLGLITIYEMKDESGKVTADMKLMFGKIGEVVHYTADNAYVKIELEY